MYLNFMGNNVLEFCMYIHLCRLTSSFLPTLGEVDEGANNNVSYVGGQMSYGNFFLKCNVLR
jgi:hypothetical protein